MAKWYRYALANGMMVLAQCKDNQGDHVELDFPFLETINQSSLQMPDQAKGLQIPPQAQQASIMKVDLQPLWPQFSSTTVNLQKSAIVFWGSVEKKARKALDEALEKAQKRIQAKEDPGESEDG